MIATESSCLTPEQLREVAGGRLPPHRFSRLLEHLDSCPQCQNRAEAALENDDSLAAALAAPLAVDPHAAEPDCVAALHRAATRRDFSADRSSPPVDQLGPYRLIRPLGSGGMGAVFLAEHTRLRRRCAVKLLPRDRGFDSAWRDRFDREMAAVAALNDPHVVSASDAGEAGGWHYLVMEYLDGLDLSRLAGRLGPLGTADACELTRQTAAGLAHIHASGLVHRDVKPSNLMLTRDGTVKILDLGLVLSGADPLPSDDRLTTVGHLMGTLAYMAPEQLVDSTTVDHRADLYALGATLYRLLVGAAPHAAARGLAPLVVAKTAKGAPAITDHRSDLPKPLVDLVTHLLDPDPKRRPQTAAEVAKALEPLAATARPERLVAEALRRGATEEESVVAPPLVAPQMSGAKQPPRRRHFAAFAAAAAALPLLLFAGIVIMIQTDRGQLVIESDRQGLAVSVEQGEETVEQLQLETGENRVTLRSGTYTVTLDTPADGLRLSDHTASITRGGETVLRVRREETPQTPPVTTTTTDSPRYRGQPFEHWLGVLENERDVESVIEAMRAVVAIGRDDGAAERSTESGESISFRAAAAVLRAARRYGGIIAAGKGSPPSQRFMNDFIQTFPGLLPNPGLEAITEELAAGNQESAMAAIWVLNDYSTERGGYAIYRPQPGALERWSESDSGREKLRNLSTNLDVAVERLGGYQLLSNVNQSIWSQPKESIFMAYVVRVKLSNLLGRDALGNPAIESRLRERVQNAADFHVRLFREADEPLIQPLTPSFGQSLPPSAVQSLHAEEIEGAFGKVEPATLAWAAVPHLLTSDHAMQRELFEQLVEAAPSATADAIIVAIHMALPEPFDGGGMGGMGGGVMPKKLPHYARQHSELWQHSLKHAAEFTSRPRFALQLFPHLHSQLFVYFAVQPQTGDIIGVKPETGEIVSLEPDMRQLYDAMQSAIATLEERAAADAAPDTEPDANGGSEEAEAPVDPGAAAKLDTLDPSRYVKYAERIISRYDENGDNVLTEDERKDMIIDFSAADADRDGRITVAEYTAWLQARAGATASPVARYRGQTFVEWLTVLEIERDVETVIDAMKAVIALSKDDRSAEASPESGKSERFRAAAAILRAARRFGGMVASNDSSQPSQRFMKELLQSYPALLPNPGLEAISEELAAGNRKSAMAAIRTLSNYATQSNSSRAHQVEPVELERWSESEAGREKLRTFSAILDAAVARLGGYELPERASADHRQTEPKAAVSIAYSLRLKIGAMLGVNSLEDPVIGSVVKKSVQDAADYHRRLFNNADEPLIQPLPSSTSHRLSDEEIEAARGSFDPEILAWAAIPYLLTSIPYLLTIEDTSPEERRALFDELAEAAPTATADATVAAIYLGLPEIYTGLPMAEPKLPYYARQQSELWQRAIDHAGRFTSRPALARELLGKLSAQLPGGRAGASGDDPFADFRGGVGGVPSGDHEDESGGVAAAGRTSPADAIQSAMEKLRQRTTASAPDTGAEASADGERAASPAPADPGPPAD